MSDESVVQGGVESGLIRVAYAMLSDLCHPATETALLYTQPAETPGWITMRGTTHDLSARWFFRNLGLMIAPIAEEARKSLIILGRLADRVSSV